MNYEIGDILKIIHRDEYVEIVDINEEARTIKLKFKEDATNIFGFDEVYESCKLHQRVNKTDYSNINIDIII